MGGGVKGEGAVGCGHEGEALKVETLGEGGLGCPENKELGDGGEGRACQGVSGLVGG